tara:strand:+ start:261 stop:944 length:684 start_codon:yes stop_codon:yes gene_type:complete
VVSLNKFSKQELELFHSRLQKHIDEQKKEWKSFIFAQQNGFYQGFDEIGIDGCRNTEKRFDRYNIENYLKKDHNALDIGCNCGFFTIHVSKFILNIDGVELNPYLINISNETKKFLQLDDVNFYNSSFEQFRTDKKYDVIFSLANDETVDGLTKFTFEEYIGKINNLLNKNGFLFWETVSPDTFEPERFKPKLESLKKLFTIIEDKMVESEYPINVPKRRFLIFQKE